MKNMIVLLVALCLTCFAAMASAFAQQDGAAVAVVDGKTADRVHLRSEPSTESESLGLYFSGAPVQRLDRVDAVWSRVTIGGETGCMMSRYLVNDLEPAECMTPHVFASADAVLLETPDAEGQALLSLARGASLRLLGETRGNWAFVETTQGTRGYLPSETIALLPEIEPAPEQLSDYLPVLTGHGMFLDVDAPDEPAERTLDDYLQARELSGFTAMALADVDGDGKREVLLRAETGVEEYHLLLDVDGPACTVRGCTLSYRAFLSPKADGTISFSSSAFEFGFGWIRFTEDSYVDAVIAQSLWDHESERVGFTLNGAPCSERMFNEVVEQQEQKPDLMWYPAENGQLPTGLLLENGI